jgi:hypothetical protein
MPKYILDGGFHWGEWLRPKGTQRRLSRVIQSRIFPSYRCCNRVPCELSAPSFLRGRGPKQSRRWQAVAEVSDNVAAAFCAKSVKHREHIGDDKTGRLHASPLPSSFSFSSQDKLPLKSSSSSSRQRTATSGLASSALPSCFRCWRSMFGPTSHFSSFRSRLYHGCIKLSAVRRPSGSPYLCHHHCGGTIWLGLKLL